MSEKKQEPPAPPPKKRNTSELSFGAAVGRLIELESEYAADLGIALSNVERALKAKLIERRAAILARVPEEIRDAVEAKAGA